MMVYRSLSCVLCFVILVKEGSGAMDEDRLKSMPNACGFQYNLDRCCRSKSHKKVAVGVCVLDKGTSIVGYNGNPRRTFGRNDAMSDKYANEDKPGADEGTCHVYEAWIGKRKACLPGNIVISAIAVEAWINGNSKLGGVTCSFNIGRECTEDISETQAYNFAFKLKAADHSAAQELRTAIKALDGGPLVGKCSPKKVGHDHYVICPL